MRLGFLEQISGSPDAAQREYQAALMENAYENTAMADLAVINASQGHSEAATRLLEKVVADDPSQTSAGLNLAFLQCKVGLKTQALHTINDVRRFNPDSPALHEFLASGKYGGQVCRVK